MTEENYFFLFLKKRIVYPLREGLYTKEDTTKVMEYSAFSLDTATSTVVVSDTPVNRQS